MFGATGRHRHSAAVHFGAMSSSTYLHPYGCEYVYIHTKCKSELVSEILMKPNMCGGVDYSKSPETGERIHILPPCSPSRYFTYAAALAARPTDRVLNRAAIAVISARNFLCSPAQLHRIAADSYAVCMYCSNREQTHEKKNGCSRRSNVPRLF